mmetsp:Transcript_32701/g.101883  ORF Transcript_32701/g.101883 Transcript_32701/m.101883 type:complete len:163 (-) Transcript_32701:414-902(-)
MSLQSGARWLKHCWSVAGTHGCAAALQMLARRWRILETRKAMLTTPPDLMLFDPVDKSSPRVQATPVHACAETATLDGLLSASECGRLIGFLESTGCFGPGDATLFGGETRVRSNALGPCGPHCVALGVRAGAGRPQQLCALLPVPEGPGLPPALRPPAPER